MSYIQDVGRGFESMNRHVGPSFTLSVLVVVFFAVVLYQPDRPPPAPTAGERTEKASSRQSIASSRAIPEPTPGTPLVDMRSDEKPAARRAPSETAYERDDAAPEVDRVQRSSLAGTVSLTTSRDPTRNNSVPPICEGERSAFTQVGDGETLTDVAVRVYGSTDAARTLWLANRDILDNGNAPLRRGTLLRTP